MRLIPLLPSRIAAQVAGALRPRLVKAPMPVMTIRVWGWGVVKGVRLPKLGARSAEPAPGQSPHTGHPAAPRVAPCSPPHGPPHGPQDEQTTRDGRELGSLDPVLSFDELDGVADGLDFLGLF